LGKLTTIKDKDKDVEAVELYALKGIETYAAMSGGVVTDAKDSFDQLGKPLFLCKMNGQGAKAWEELTTEHTHKKSNIAIVLDDIVYSAPGVSSDPFQVVDLKSLIV
jgi:SecD/SecF fusion protein